MMYIKWALYYLLNLPIMIMCYVTNPIVVLFCNQNGELPKWCKLWQTHDDSVYSSDVVKKKELPDCLLYDYDKHYAERYDMSDQELEAVNNGRYYSDCIDDNFTFVEKIKRYICGVYWLTRNCGYGWAFWLFGCNIIPADAVYTKTGDVIIGTYQGQYWTYSNSSRICTIFGRDIFWNTYLGWKFRKSNDTVITRCPLAIRVALKIKKVVG